MMRLPNTVPIPAPDPATPTVAAPAPMNLAAVSMSLLIALVWMPLSVTWVRGLCGITATPLWSTNGYKLLSFHLYKLIL